MEAKLVPMVSLLLSENVSASPLFRLFVASLKQKKIFVNINEIIIKAHLDQTVYVFFFVAWFKQKI